VTPNPALAAWLVSRRREIDSLLTLRLGADAPSPRDSEAEALRRFRSFVSSSLLHGESATPALDGLRARPAAVASLLEAWIQAASEEAGPDADPVGRTLRPLAQRFEAALRGTSAVRRVSGAPRSSRRRAVAAAIDRVADAFLAIDTETGRIADANPAAGALLGVARDDLLEANAMQFVPDAARGTWWTHLEAMAEGSEPRRFQARLQNSDGAALEVEASVTRLSTRRHSLALVLARPVQS
jgi:PAS domain S-box-containing protein